MTRMHDLTSEILFHLPILLLLRTLKTWIWVMWFVPPPSVADTAETTGAGATRSIPLRRRRLWAAGPSSAPAEVLPPSATPANPVDRTGDVSGRRWRCDSAVAGRRWLGDRACSSPPHRRLLRISGINENLEEWGMEGGSCWEGEGYHDGGALRVLALAVHFQLGCLAVLVSSCSCRIGADD
jgi:hypothetical protein